jgi:hypothetical protein
MDKNMKQNIQNISNILFSKNICYSISFLETINTFNFTYKKLTVILILRKQKYVNKKWSKYIFRILGKRDITFSRIDSFKNYLEGAFEK